ncbi:BgTH12-04595 [Blumeria graminis f. sp. triticale]|uniref:Bgt-2078 n=3 Tax=Blumeria graminis TaxID=34373 RepID=A0A381L3Z3_BLUGR|nr:hypothetical protein BGT96224_2078 [Blumeria graminis f. sp. tritici 96224]CAD6498939.1 BgTH12-04595 [Blumeria graminis f. sp. triticale]VCU39059.1 Bgt-2078 [Blumeria graminis f. sp. tritici]
MTSPRPRPATPPKLARLPKNYRVRKRPLLHAPLAPPRAGADVPKLIYLSSRSSFVATIKRVRSLLSHVESRSSASDAAALLQRDPRSFMRSVAAERATRKTNSDGGKRMEEVVIKASGKAIEKALQIAAWWQSQDDVKVELQTASVGAIDDIVNAEGVEEDSQVRRVSVLEIHVRLI